MKRILLAFLAIILLTSVASADTLYLRDGRTLNGTLLGFINGRFAFKVSALRNTPTTSTATTTTTPATTTTTTPTTTTSTNLPVRDGEILFFRPNEVERIEIDGRSLDELKFETRNVDVQLGADWIDSGVTLRRNQRVQVTATGTILVGRSRITPDGLRTSDPNSPLPRAADGMLVGAIGDDPTAPIFEIGSTREFVADRDGRLYLTANRSSYSEARGSFSVQIKTERDLTAETNNNPFGGRGRGRSRSSQSTTRTPRQSVVDVAGTSRSVDTQIDVRAGDQVTFSATGVVIAGRRIGEVGPEGGRSSGFGSIVGTRPVPTAGPGALVGFIRTPTGQTNQPFLIGGQLTYTATTDGRLYLAVNDDDYSDNGGAFKVTIKY